MIEQSSTRCWWQLAELALLHVQHVSWPILYDLIIVDKLIDYHGCVLLWCASGASVSPYHGMVCEWGECVLNPHVCGYDCAMTPDSALWFLSAYVIVLLTSFRGLLLDRRCCVLRSSPITRELMFGAMCKTPCLASLS